MRKEAIALLFEAAKNDKDIILITADMGWGILDKFRDELPGQFYNVGISEQLAVNMAVGMALSGKKPWIYGIISFQIYRALSQIRDYVIHLNLPVKFIGIGKDTSYKKLDYSHWAVEDKEIYTAIGMPWVEPEINTLKDDIQNAIESKKPVMVRLG